MPGPEVRGHIRRSSSGNIFEEQTAMKFRIITFFSVVLTVFMTVGSVAAGDAKTGKNVYFLPNLPPKLNLLRQRNYSYHIDIELIYANFRTNF